MKSLFVAVSFLLAAIPAVSQKSRFKVVAFYSANGEMDHVNFAKDALYFFGQTALDQQFTFDVTTDWSNLKDDYLSNYNVVMVE
ncbi:MAG TPA: hypothetical protein VK508_14880 [Cyclobacteriaceae bacterium]|nr:hypothetical protein [Cyclobacteriaceae bacterium]